MNIIKKAAKNIIDTFHAAAYTPLISKSTADDEFSINTLPQEKAMSSARFFFGLSLAVISDIVLNTCEALWLRATAFVGLGFAAVGAADLGYRIFKAYKKADETIIEMNMDGQTVQGKRRDLYKLHEAQVRINNLSIAFNNAKCIEVVDKEIQKIIDKTADIRARTTVTDMGKSGHKHYHFRRVHVDFVDALEDARLPVLNKNHHRFAQKRR